MKKFIIAFSLACASTFAFGRPELTPDAWFSADATSGTGTPDGGSWSSTAPQIADQKYVISTDLASPIKFITDLKSPAGDYAETTFNLVTTIVPAAGRVTLTGGTIAFVASEDNGTKAYYAWLGGTTGWKKLAGVTPGDEGTAYTLVVTFDTWTSGQRRVQFKVGGTALYLDNTSANATWLTYDEPRFSGTQFAINFAGDGTVESFVGKQLNITAEIVDESNGTIRIPKADVLKFNIPTGTDKETYFESAAAEKFGGFATPNVSVAAAYVLGLIAANGDSMAVVDGGELRPRAYAESGNKNGVVVNLNVVPKPSTDKPETNTGVTIAFGLYKRGEEVDTLITESYELVDNKPCFVIPTGAIAAGNQAFKIVAKITPKASAQ